MLPDEGNCWPTVPLSPDDVRYIDELIIRINAMIAEQAAKHGADYVDTYAGSGGHDVCKLPPTRWFEGLVPTEPAFPLHPNGKGLASMGRSAIETLKGPPAATPVISKLRVKPKRVKSGRPAKVRFRLDSAAEVDIAFASKSVGGQGRAGNAVMGARAGRNKLWLRPNLIGRSPGRFKVTVVAAAYGFDSAPAKTRFRIVRPKG